MAPGKSFVNSKTGYLMFFAEEKKKKFDEEPAKLFSVPEFSTMVSTRWKEMTRTEKNAYMRQATAENDRLAAIEYIEYDDSDLPKLPPGQAVHTCRWEDGEAPASLTVCNRMFQCEDGLLRHISADHFHDNAPHPCRWLSCSRNIRNKVFDRKGKLTNHLKNQHLRRDLWPGALCRSVHDRPATVYEHAQPAPAFHLIPNKPFVPSPVITETLVQSQGRVLFPPHPTEEMFMPPGIDFFTQVRIRMEEGTLDPIGYFKLLSTAVDRSAAVVLILDPDTTLGADATAANLGISSKAQSSSGADTTVPTQPHTQTQTHPHAQAQAHTQGESSTRMNTGGGAYGTHGAQPGYAQQPMDAHVIAPQPMQVDDPNVELYAPAARLSPARLKAEQAGIWRTTHSAAQVQKIHALKHTAEYILFKQGYRRDAQDVRAGPKSQKKGFSSEEQVQGSRDVDHAAGDTSRDAFMDIDGADGATDRTEETVLDALGLLCKGLGVVFV